MPLPEFEPGIYHGTAKSAMTEKTVKGSTCLAVEFDIEFVAVNSEWVKLPAAKRRTVRFYMTDAARPISFEKLAKMEFNGSFATPEFSKPGQTLECRHEEYPKASGKHHERWDIQGDKREVEPASRDETRALESLWRANMKPAGKPTAPPAAPAEPKKTLSDAVAEKRAENPNDPPPPTDESIPF